MRRLRRIFLLLAGLGIVICGLAAHYYYKGFYSFRHAAGAGRDGADVGDGGPSTGSSRGRGSGGPSRRSAAGQTAGAGRDGADVGDGGPSTGGPSTGGPSTGSPRGRGSGGRGSGGPSRSSAAGQTEGAGRDGADVGDGGLSTGGPSTGGSQGRGSGGPSWGSAAGQTEGAGRDGADARAQGLRAGAAGGSEWRGLAKSPAPSELLRLDEKAAALRRYLRASGGKYNGSIAFLLDMQLPSGRNRFFVYDLAHDSIRMSGLVAHGNGGSVFSLSPRFSNVVGSRCSALGRYRIGGAYTGHFGRSYTLYGLDATNSQSLVRHIVLHPYECVPEAETDPYPICNSEGCAMVSPGFMKRLQPLLDARGKSVLLWIFN